MTLNLNDPRSMVAWCKVRPDVHGPQLEALVGMWPEFRKPYVQALQIIDDEQVELEASKWAEAA